MSVYSIDKLMSEARRLAADYRRATGKSLPISGEIAVYDAIALLDLEPATAGVGGYDAVRRLNAREEKIQIKSRVIFDDRKGGHRLGQIKADQPWDILMLVLMDENYESMEIFEARREEVLPGPSDKPESKPESKRARRGAISVARFKIIGQLVWSREQGRVSDGVWDNQADAP